MTKEGPPKEIAKRVTRHNTAKLLPDMRVVNGLFPLPTIPGAEALPKGPNISAPKKAGGD